MLPGPILRRELKVAARARGTFQTRIVLCILLVAFTVLCVVAARGWAGFAIDVHEPRALWTFGRTVFIAVFVIELLFAMTLAVVIVSPAVAEEREKDTLPLLLLTRLTHIEIIVTKLIGRLVPALSLVLVGLPLAGASAWLAGLPLIFVVGSLVITASTVTVAGAFSILASARRDRVGSARAQAMSWAFLWFLMIPICSIVPISTGTVWRDVLRELPRLCGWIAPSSPLSLVTRSGWINDRSGQVLQEQIFVMLVFQGALIGLAVLWAAPGLRLRGLHGNSPDSRQGFRPPVGDDPVFWREYTLPYRGARYPLILLQARHVVILLRLIVVTALQAVGWAFVVAIPVGLATATARFGYLALLEMVRDGNVPTGAAPARDQFNLLIRFVTGVLAVIPIASLPAIVTGRVTIERDKQTWDGLLLTPLTGVEILSSKMRVSAVGLWKSSRWLIPIWGLGIVVGSLNPLTALLAAIELPLAAWLGMSLGAWLAVRPASALTTTANSHAALVSLGLGIIVGASVLALLCSHRDLAVFATWNIWLRAIVAAALAVTPPVLAWIASTLRRRTFNRFDEWVGRPHRKPQTSSTHD
jgi:hypothetical protein